MKNIKKDEDGVIQNKIKVYKLIYLYIIKIYLIEIKIIRGFQLIEFINDGRIYDIFDKRFYDF